MPGFVGKEVTPSGSLLASSIFPFPEALFLEVPDGSGMERDMLGRIIRTAKQGLQIPLPGLGMEGVLFFRMVIKGSDQLINDPFT